MPHTHRDKRPETEIMIHCGSCNLVLAGWLAGLLVVRRERTEIVAERIHSIRCHRCGTNNEIAPISPLPAVTSSEFSHPTLISVVA